MRHSVATREGRASGPEEGQGGQNGDPERDSLRVASQQGIDRSYPARDAQSARV